MLDISTLKTILLIQVLAVTCISARPQASFDVNPPAPIGAPGILPDNGLAGDTAAIGVNNVQPGQIVAKIPASEEASAAASAAAGRPVKLVKVIKKVMVPNSGATVATSGDGGATITTNGDGSATTIIGGSDVASSSGVTTVAAGHEGVVTSTDGASVITTNDVNGASKTINFEGGSGVTSVTTSGGTATEIKTDVSGGLNIVDSGNSEVNGVVINQSTNGVGGGIIETGTSNSMTVTSTSGEVSTITTGDSAVEVIGGAGADGLTSITTSAAKSDASLGLAVEEVAATTTKTQEFESRGEFF